jgi:sugar phosphate isomerase/epimerase
LKFAYSSLACPQWSIEGAVEAAVRYGYDAIEWRLADGEIISSDTPAQARRRLRDVPMASGIVIACLDTSCKVTQATAEARAMVIEEGQRMLDMAVELGTQLVRVFGGTLPIGTTRAELLEPAAEVLRALGVYASERNLTLLLETHDIWTRSEDVRALIQATNSPAVKVLWDVHHTYRSGEAPEASVALLGDLIAYVHIKDSQARADTSEEWEFCLLTEGSVPLRETCSVLKRSGYDTYLSLEWEKKWHPAIAEPEIALPQAISWLRRLWSEV